VRLPSAKTQNVASPDGKILFNQVRMPLRNTNLVEIVPVPNWKALLPSDTSPVEANMYPEPLKSWPLPFKDRSDASPQDSLRAPIPFEKAI